MKHTTHTRWIQGLHFISQVDNGTVDFDAAALSTENNQGVSPKKIILSGLAGCTGMDVAALLTKKFRIPFKDLDVEVSGELTDTHPKYYNKIHLVYHIRVAEEDRVQVKKAVDLSTEKYCGVHAMLGKAALITHEINYL